jgi:hypothetical protein
VLVTLFYYILAWNLNQTVPSSEGLAQNWTFTTGAGKPSEIPKRIAVIQLKKLEKSLLNVVGSVP